MESSQPLSLAELSTPGSPAHVSPLINAPLRGIFDFNGLVK
jgi:hypothetical protein